MSRTARDALALLPFDLVLILWVDSAHVGTGWTDFEEITQGDAQLLCASVGFLARETRDAKLLVPSIADLAEPDNRQSHGAIMIPKRAILAERILRRAS